MVRKGSTVRVRQRALTNGLLSRLPVAVAEVVEVEVAATRGREEERRPGCDGWSIDGLERNCLQRDRTHAAVGLRTFEASVAVGAAHVHDARLAVDVPVLE